MEQRKVGPLEYRDTALAFVFIFLLIYFFSGKSIFLYVGMGFTLYAMILPNTLKPLAKAWFGLSYVLGLVVSKVLLSIVYIVLVLPVGLIRKAMGKDSMRLRQWHRGSESAFVVREHVYTKDDLANMF